MPNIGEVVLRDLKDVYHTTASCKIKTYSYNGATGLTMGQLLMAVCLYRANKIEEDTITLMDKMARDTDLLNTASKVANDIVNTPIDQNYSAGNTITYNGTTLTVYDFITGSSYLAIPASSIPGNASSAWNNSDRTTVYNQLKTKMDSLNSISQEDMIELQSLINKRDQSYNLASSSVKLILNSALATSNNL